jgi:hypothetical protein
MDDQTRFEIWRKRLADAREREFEAIQGKTEDDVELIIRQGHEGAVCD